MAQSVQKEQNSSLNLGLTGLSVFLTFLIPEEIPEKKHHNGGEVWFCSDFGCVPSAVTGKTRQGLCYS